MSSKTVFISGSSRGIGRATAHRFARAGYAVVITFASGPEEAQTVARECEALGALQTAMFELDLRSDQSIMEVARQTKEKFGSIDVLINNAGVFQKGPLFEQSFADIHNQISVNLEGLIKLTKEFLPDVRETVINIGSGIGSVGKKNAAVYVATKWALRGFTKSLAKEMPGLRAYTVDPGLTATRMGSADGMAPDKVAEVIFNAATGKYCRASGDDIDVKYHVLGPAGKAIFLVKSAIQKFLHETHLS